MKRSQRRILMTCVLPCLLLSMLAFEPSATIAQTDSAETSDNSAVDTTQQDDTKKEIPKSRTRYMGRRIAQTMHYTGAEWLIRNVREREERCSLMLANLGVRPGQTVCDMGCGNGFHSLPIARMVGEEGQVLAVDVQPKMLEFLRDRMEKEVIENIVPILGSYHNPHLPKDSNDIVLMVDVYHEFSHPEEMLAAIKRSLKPRGLVVLVEYREEDPDVPIKPLHKMSKEQVNKELTANGFRLVKEFDLLPWQHMMFFGHAEEDSEKEEGDAKPADKTEKSPAAGK
ncbi:MAG: class I SAM-dependent methyltransferase [Planctomycetota bacterium]